MKAPLDLPKIRSLILLLGSENADMVVTTVVAIRRCLQSSGHDFNDLAALLAPPKSVTHREIARRILRHSDGDLLLNEKELAFVEVMARAPHCSDRQADWLEAIYAKIF